MWFFTKSLAAIGVLLLLPISTLATPPTEQTPAVEAILPRGLTPHTECYVNSQQFKDLAAWPDVQATVKAGCDTFANRNNGHVFRVGDQVSWCQNTIAGKGSINFMFKYKGPTDTFTPLNKDNVGGLSQYCLVATGWTLARCRFGGVFYNHQLGNAQGTRYWDVKLDPNTKSC